VLRLFFSAAPFPGIIWLPLPFSKLMLEMRAEMHIGRYLKCPLFLPVVTKI
jgi:hypothetical protein